MKHFFSTRIRVVLVVTLLLAGILAVIGNLTGLSFPSMLVKGILTPLRTGVSRLTDQAENLYSYIFEHDSLLEENARLKQQLAEIEDDARNADAIARENARLRELLNLQQSDED